MVYHTLRICYRVAAYLEEECLRSRDPVIAAGSTQGLIGALAAQAVVPARYKSPFHYPLPPPLPLTHFLRHIALSVDCSPACFIIALALMLRYCDITKSSLSHRSAHLLSLVAFMVAVKVLDDVGAVNARCALVAQLPLQDLNRLESFFLNAISWRTFVLDARYQQLYGIARAAFERSPHRAEMERDLSAVAAAVMVAPVPLVPPTACKVPAQPSMTSAIAAAAAAVVDDKPLPELELVPPVVVAVARTAAAQAPLTAARDGKASSWLRRLSHPPACALSPSAPPLQLRIPKHQQPAEQVHKFQFRNEATCSTTRFQDPSFNEAYKASVGNPQGSLTFDPQQRQLQYSDDTLVSIYEPTELPECVPSLPRQQPGAGRMETGDANGSLATRQAPGAPAAPQEPSIIHHLSNHLDAPPDLVTEGRSVSNEREEAELRGSVGIGAKG